MWIVRRDYDRQRHLCTTTFAPVEHVWTIIINKLCVRIILLWQLWNQCLVKQGARQCCGREVVRVCTVGSAYHRGGLDDLSFFTAGMLACCWLRGCPVAVTCFTLGGSLTGSFSFDSLDCSVSDRYYWCWYNLVMARTFESLESRESLRA